MWSIKSTKSLLLFIFVMTTQMSICLGGFGTMKALKEDFKQEIQGLRELIKEGLKGTGVEGKCIYIRDDDGSSFAEERKSDRADDGSSFGEARKSKAPINPCSIPHNKYKIKILDRVPYSSTMTPVIKDMIEKCCHSKNPIINESYTQSLKSLINEGRKPDFIFPVFASKSSKAVYGYYFVPLLDPPGAFYITVDQSPGLIDVLVKSSDDVLPVVLVGIVMAIWAGFLIWLTETWSNDDEFQRCFIKGWAEGIWWSFISMTTVGYGDKTPKSALGRIISIIWIILGITIFSILSGKLTTVMLKVKESGDRNMAGERVGVLQNRLYDKGVVTRLGGIYIKPDVSRDPSELQQLFWLISQLRSVNIDGFLLDKFTYWKMTEKIRNESCSRTQEEEGLAEFFIQKTVTTNVPSLGEDVSYGVLIENIQRYRYFGPVIQGNKQVVQTSISKHLKASTRREAGNSKLVKDLEESRTLFMFFAIVLTLCVGSLVECCWRKKMCSVFCNGNNGRRRTVTGERKNHGSLF